MIILFFFLSFIYLIFIPNNIYTFSPSLSHIYKSPEYVKKIRRYDGYLLPHLSVSPTSVFAFAPRDILTPHDCRVRVPYLCVTGHILRVSALRL